MGLAVGFLIGIWLAPHAAGLVRSDLAKAGIALGTVLLLGATGDAIGSVIGIKVRRRALKTRFKTADAIGGSALSVSALVLAIWFLGINLAAGPFPSVARALQRSAVVRAVDAALPPPPVLAAQLGNVLDIIGFPDIFAGLPPLPADPVPQPTQGLAGRAARDARPVPGARRRPRMRRDPPGHRVRRRRRPGAHERTRDRRGESARGVERSDLRRRAGAVRRRPRRGDPPGRRPGCARAHAADGRGGAWHRWRRARVSAWALHGAPGGDPARDGRRRPRHLLGGPHRAADLRAPGHGAAGQQRRAVRPPRREGGGTDLRSVRHAPRSRLRARVASVDPAGRTGGGLDREAVSTGRCAA